MAEFQELLDFPPAPKLNVFGKLDPAKASESELRGQEIFFGKAQCATCHPPPYYTDNLMHNLQVERFFKEVTINGRKASADGPIKTFPLRGIKDSPPYLHDDRLLTLEDTVEFFNLVLELKLTAAGEEGPRGLHAGAVDATGGGGVSRIPEAGSLRLPSGTRSRRVPSRRGRATSRSRHLPFTGHERATEGRQAGQFFVDHDSCRALDIAQRQRLVRDASTGRPAAADQSASRSGCTSRP